MVDVHKVYIEGDEMRYYCLEIDEGNKKKYAYGLSVTEWPRKWILCSKCQREWKKSVMHDFGTDTPIVLSNDNYPDFLWFYINHISEKAKDVLEREKITGYRLEKAPVLSFNDLTDMQLKELRRHGTRVNKIPTVPPAYYKLHVDVCAELYRKSNIILLDSCSECGYETYLAESKERIESRDSLFLRGESLNGIDLFRAKGYGVNIYCSERFVEAYQRHELTGLMFTEIVVL
ncbi:MULTISPECIES: double-CXXCG motif protein [Desulfitobacterium]|uniref:Uncharacterized protein n=1 Tax=Desulfitobacterium dehalogenans (strain ATCC 51507 / DSM 9161 / JW/IU-DC1) TaxID=756499 RepID=I4A7B6_DESDJ|nr:MULTISPECIES: double-CXXCG motif protein [Desulfitobacterium]AFL99850.1 Protein of unknown function (Gmx_para_CXXCG) [Desulfitobacterium dehalogenans ATCC 51507]